MKLVNSLSHNKKSYIAYITAGHKGLEYTEQAALALINGGVNILEIGIPFSDPIADGPVIQEAMTDSLNRFTNLEPVLRSVKKIKNTTEVPIVIFSYYNPLLSIGIDKSFSMIAEANADAILIVDLPIEESKLYIKKCKEYNIEPIFLLSPSTNEERVKKIIKHSNSFLYYVCRNGTTGMRPSLPEDYIDKINRLKAITPQPIVTGFGISNKEMALEALKHADGFVVGSTFVKAISEGATPSELTKLAKKIDPR